MQATNSLNLTLEEFAEWCNAKVADLVGIDYSEPIASAVLILKSYTQQNFDEGHGPDGVPWAALKNPRPRGGDKPLRDTDMLMASMTGEGEGHVDERTGTTLVWGTNLPYAAIHQYGGTIHKAERTRTKPWVFAGPGGKKIFTRRIRAHDVLVPARPFLGFNEEMNKDIEDVFVEFLRGKLES